jgi:hypothetical protein
VLVVGTSRKTELHRDRSETAGHDSFSYKGATTEINRVLSNSCLLRRGRCLG